MRMLRRSTITCPRCGATETVTMPVDACEWFHECRTCHALLRPKPGDCCVFCSWGDVPCPSIQRLRFMARTGTEGPG